MDQDVGQTRVENYDTLASVTNGVLIQRVPPLWPHGTGIFCHRASESASLSLESCQRELNQCISICRSSKTRHELWFSWLIFGFLVLVSQQPCLHSSQSEASLRRQDNCSFLPAVSVVRCTMSRCTSEVGARGSGIADSFEGCKCRSKETGIANK